MADIELDIADFITRATLKAMLEAEGHRVVTEAGAVHVTDNPVSASAQAAHMPTLLLASTAQIPDAIDAMRQGVHGYIFLPFQPGEAPLMVQRALTAPSAATSTTPEPLLTLAQAETAHIARVLRACKHNQAKAAQVLGIGRNTLWRKLKQGKGSPSSGAK